MKTLRYYQEEAHQAILNDIDEGVNSMLLHMATGTGKTYTTTSLVAKAQFKNVLWLTHKEELIDQSTLSLILSLTDDEIHDEVLDLFERFKHGFLDLMKFISQSTRMSIEMDRSKNALIWIRDNVGLIKQKVNQYDKPYVIASIQTAARRLEELEKYHFDCIVIDEAHLALSKTWVSVCDTTPHTYRLGLTATPERMDGLAMDNLFSKISYTYDLRQAIEDKFLCQIEAIRIKTQIDLNSVRTTAGELNNKDLSIVDCPERNNLICDEWLEKADGRKTLAFCVNINHAANLCQTMKNRGIKADIVVSNEEICPSRRKAIRKFTHGDTQVLVNVDILTTGFDYPMVGCIIMARPTKSKNLYIQMVGRGTRLKLLNDYEKTYGQKFLLLDIVDVTSRHALINAYALDHGKRIEDRVFVTDEERERLLESRERQENERIAKINRFTKENVVVDLLALPEIDVKELYKLDQQSPTDKQIAELQRLGYDTEKSSFTKASAFMAIGNQEASFREKAILKSMNYDVEFGATRYQYVEAMRQKAVEFQESINKTKTQNYS